MRHMIVVVILPALLLAACSKEPVEPREVVRPVKTYVYSGKGAALTFTYPGRVYANRTVEIAFEVTGKLEELPVVRGQKVKQGDLLARLDQRDYVNELDKAKSTHLEAKAAYERFLKAYETRAVAKQEVDERKARMDVTMSEVKIKEKALADTEMRADFDGIVANRYFDNFQNVVAKEPVFSLQDISKLEIRINIPEGDFGKAGKDKGKGARHLNAEFASVAGKTFPLTVKEFATDADPVTQTFLVTLTMPMPEDTTVLPGMTATVIWNPPGKAGQGAATVPAAAVGGLPGDRAWVWVLDKQAMTVSRREVKLGRIISGGAVEVTGGLQPGEVIAAAGVYLLDDGMTVKELVASGPVGG